MISLFYKNVSRSTKTFYGVEFPPGGEGEVSGYINAEGFIRIHQISVKPVKLKKETKSSKESNKKPIKKADPAEPQKEPDNTEGGNT